MRVFCLLLLSLSLGATARADETFRCGSWLVSSDLTVAELLSRCGEPTARESATEDVWVRNANGSRSRAGTTTTWIWTYDRGPSAAPMVVTIVDGEIRRIERKR